ncbi:cytochrome P450 9e2 [Papilio machaon]|uniref:cytochrome P450 9e2 n=1 Tax=Papilio machaon TaxID=76193 RepID=UPI001E664193|nr:cytochrome P450 9e2 [Papilio machaon]
MAFLIWVLLAVILLLYFRQVYSKFAKAGVNHLPVIPLLGNSGHTLLRLDNIINRITLAYKSFPEDYFIGFYELMNPLIIVKDVKVVKQIAVKDFEYFVDRRGFGKEFADPLFGRNLLFLKGEEWKAMRSTLSPAFTSTKIRLMVPLMVEVGDHMIRTLKKKIDESGVNYVDIECKDLGTRYANDVIASCAFGLRVTSLEEGNQFYEYCKAMTTISFVGMLKILGYRTCPKILKMFNVNLSSKALSSFFSDLVLGTMRQREEQHVLRNDMIQLLMEAKKGTLSHDSKVVKDADAGFATVEESAVGKNKVAREWSDVDLVAQAVLFLIAGFETVSTVIAFTLYELALHPDVQERLVQEIKENVMQDKDNTIDYNAIQRMKYLDMVVSEVLRLWPPAPVADRKAARDYNLGRPNSTAQEDYIIRKGETVQIPIWAFHRDPKYFPDPEKFDPDRFSEENKHKIDPFSYMPFGVGPRNCIGSRFALCELKVALYQLLQHIEVSTCARTPVPARLQPDSFQVRLAGGHWLRLKPRN